MKVQDQKKRFLLLQINDALFPIGAYSHSYGLETYIQKNLVRTTEDAWEFISRRMTYGFCCNEFLSARLAYEYARKEDLASLMRLEENLDASRVPREIREAGCKLGSRFVKTVKQLDLPYETDLFVRYCESRGKGFMTHSVVYGVFCAAVGIPCEDALEHYLYAQTSSMVTNCVKSIPLSQTDGQLLLCRCQGLFEDLLNRVALLTEEDLCLAAPGFDIRCMQHEGLYSRIYMS
jgi:urease accessory protein